MASSVTTKPLGSISLDSGATYYPDHLWLMNEGSGTTVEDLIGTADLTINGPTWITNDADHTYALNFAGTDDIASYTGTANILGLSTSFSVGVLVQMPATASGVVEGIAGFGTSTAGQGKFGLTQGTGGDLGWYMHQTGQTESAGSTAAFGALDTGTWKWIMGSFNSVATNGTYTITTDGAGDENTPSLVHLISNCSAINTFILGCKFDSSPSNYLTGKIAAVALWINTYYNEPTQLAIFNSGDPWTSLGVSVAAGHPTRSRARGIPGMNTIASRFGRGW